MLWLKRPVLTRLPVFYGKLLNFRRNIRNVKVYSVLFQRNLQQFIFIYWKILKSHLLPNTYIWLYKIAIKCKLNLPFD